MDVDCSPKEWVGEEVFKEQNALKTNFISTRVLGINPIETNV